MATIQGKIISAMPARQGQNDNGSWMAQDFLLESYDTPYSRKCLFSVWGADRLTQFNIKEGDDVAVDVDIDAREYNGRYYNSVRAWRVNHITAPQPSDPNVAPIGQPVTPTAPVGAPVVQPAPAPTAPAADPFAGQPGDGQQSGDVADDLPF